jgi:hypothetical protein
LNALLLPVPAYKGVEDCEDVPAVFNHSRKDITQAGLTFCFTMPFGEDGRGNFDIATELLGGMAAKEEAIEKSGFPLRDIEVQRDFRRNKLCHCGHGERAVYRKPSRRQVVPCSGCYLPDNTVRKPNIRCKLRVPDTTPILLGAL